jgi:peptide/nickel transport system substrate-binding protein
MKRLAASLALAALLSVPASAQQLRIGLQEDPDILDGAKNWTFVGRLVMQALCDKLVDIDTKANIVPMLATSWTSSEDGRVITLSLRDDALFHDGEKVDAAAVKFSLDRALTMADSRRKGEIAAIKAVEATDPKTVRIEMGQAFSPLLAQFADRAGIIHSPKAVQAAGNDQFGQKPVCAGPYKFVERVAQDRIVMERFEGYRDRDKFPPGRLVFLPVPDTTVRFANLRSGQLDLIERMSPNDVEAAKSNKQLGFAAATSLGYQGLTFNIANGEKAKGPFGTDKRLRAALDFAIDRETLVQVVSGGIFTPGNQPVPPGSPFYVADLPVPKRDLAKARALVKESGVANPTITFLTPNTDIAKQAMEVIQAMAKEAGIEVKIQTIEFVTMLAQARDGNFEADYVGWSGRIDPDGNISNLLACKSAGNDGKYCNETVERLLKEAQLSVDPAVRKKSYDPAIRQLLEDRPILYLWHGTWLYAFNAGLKGFVPYPDGIVRLNGVSLNKS